MGTQIHTEIAESSFDPEAAQFRFRQALGHEAGAICTFTGLVRASGDKNAVTHLELQHYPGFTEKEMARIARDAAEHWPLDAITLIHRTGAISPAEPIVFVATASKHRRAAFEAADFLMDYLKSDAPFWKKERRSDGDHWIEPRPEDYADKARWGSQKGNKTHARD